MQKVMVSREKLYKLLEDQDGKFFSVVFRKLDGSNRKINGRLGVKKYLHGGVNKVVRYDNPYEVVFDVQQMDYRTTNLHTIERVFANRTEYVVEG